MICAYALSPYMKNTLEFDWTYNYGYLSCGQYRIVKEVINRNSKNNDDRRTFYIEFEIR